jgi:hypothetical protein
MNDEAIMQTIENHILMERKAKAWDILREKLESREAMLDRIQPAANERRINHA